MIKVTNYRDHVGQIERFTLFGHAGFADKGEDIVCAAVSGITFGTINAVDALLHIQLPVQMEEESGLLECTIPMSLPTDQQDKLQLLLEAMFVSLQSIASEYKQFITVQEYRR